MAHTRAAVLAYPSPEILRIEHSQANPLKLSLAWDPAEEMPSGLTLRAEIHPSRSVADDAIPLAAVTLDITNADTQPWTLEFSSQQTNLDLGGRDQKTFVLTISGIETSTRFYTLADADLVLFRHPCSQLVPPAVSPLLYATTEDLDDIDARLTVVEETGGGGGGGGVTNLAAVASPTNVVITSDTGTDATIPAADGTNAGLMLPAQVTKLAGVATEATANATDAQLRDRSTHTGTQAISTIANLQTSLDGKADLVGGKLNTSQLPDLAISQYLGTAANQSAMLLLVGQRGDWCTRTDDGKVYVVTGEPSSTLGNWTSLSYPTAPVLSVAGRTGAITLSSSDILGLGTLATQSGTFSGTSSGTNTGNVTLAASVSSVLTLSGQQIQAVTDPVADRIVFFDQSAASMAYATLGSCLSTSGTTLNVTLETPGPIGGTTPGEGTFNQLNARTSLEVQATTGAGGPLRVWNTGTDTPTNWTRARLQWSSNVFIVGTEANGTGVSLPMDFQTGGTTRMTLGASGGLSLANGNSITINGSAASRALSFTYSSITGIINSGTEGGYGILQLRVNNATLLELNNQTGARLILADGAGFTFGTTTGTRIGTATTQKMGFWNTTPVVQPTAVADATDAASVITQLNALLARLRTIGIIAT